MIAVVDFGAVQQQRKDAAEQTMRTVTAAEVAATVEKIFAGNASHP